MKPKQFDSEYQRSISVLRAKLENIGDCTDLIDSYADVMNSIWNFTAHLIGDGGASAVVSRSVRVAARQVPIAGLAIVGHDGIDFSRFRAEALSKGCTTVEMLDGFIHLGATVFQTLQELTGDAITGPLLKRLQGEEESSS
ncbi:MAG: hypothetical protein HYY30_11770 [Chloroflexi bacterium]|nr:hypothetical protein [Chloroflexota bacterium]